MAEEVKEPETDISSELQALSDQMAGKVSEDTEQAADEEPKEETNEAEETNDESTESEEETEETEDLSDPLAHLKAQVGRVPAIQSKTEKNSTEIQGLKSTIEKLTSLLQPKQESTEGLIDKLTDENGEANLKNMIREVIKAEVGPQLDEQKQVQQNAQYTNTVMKMAGNRWGDIEPAAAQVLSDLQELVDKGVPGAEEELSITLSSPSHMMLLAEKELSRSISEKGNQQKEGRKAKAKTAGNLSSDKASVPTDTSPEQIRKLPPGEAEKQVMELLKKEGANLLG